MSQQSNTIEFPETFTEANLQKMEDAFTGAFPELSITRTANRVDVAGDSASVQELLAAAMAPAAGVELRAQTFRAWLLKQAGRDDPVGDLAQDVARDAHPNATVAGGSAAETAEAVRRRMVLLRASAPALAALRRAVAEYGDPAGDLRAAFLVGEEN